MPFAQNIIEIELSAEGFIEAKVLAHKFITLFLLSKELLSKQMHYDWGLSDQLDTNPRSAAPPPRRPAPQPRMPSPERRATLLPAGGPSRACCASRVA